MRIDILTLFPEMCEAVLEKSIIGKAREKGVIEIFCHNLRDYARDKHRRVDDYPYGGGAGMIIAPQPIVSCFEDICRVTGKRPHTLYMSPKGRVFDQKMAVELSGMDELCIICGHYEGIDQRVIDLIVDEECSAGDFVLTGGELPALMVTDAVSRLIPGVLSDEVCFTDESHFNGLLEYPQYTRPQSFRDLEVPQILLSGHHGNIEKWRREKQIEITRLMRPDLLDKTGQDNGE